MLEVTLEIWFTSPQDRLLEDAAQNSMHELVEHIQLYKQMVSWCLLVSLSNLRG